MKNNLLNNNIADLIDNLIKTIFQSLNCVKVGKVIKFYPEDKTADIQIITKIKDTNNNLKDIAILSKCLVIGNKITLPIEEGEDVVILFNDYDINAYFETGQSQEPYSSRKHSLSDGIVICGLNSIINAINYDNTAICFNHKQIKVNGNLEVNGDQQNNGNITTTGNNEAKSYSTNNKSGLSTTIMDTGTGATGKSWTFENGILVEEM